MRSNIRETPNPNPRAQPPQAAANSDQQLQQAVRDREELCAPACLSNSTPFSKRRDTARGLVVNMSDVLFRFGQIHAFARPRARSLPRFPASSLAYPTLALSIRKATPIAWAATRTTRPFPKIAPVPCVTTSASKAHSRSVHDGAWLRQIAAGRCPTTLPADGSRIAASNSLYPAKSSETPLAPDLRQCRNCRSRLASRLGVVSSPLFRAFDFASSGDRLHRNLSFDASSAARKIFVETQRTHLYIEGFWSSRT